MNLLMLNYEFPPIGGGGGQAHLSLLHEYAGRADLTVDVLTSTPQLGQTVEAFAENVRIHKVGIHKQNLHFWRRSEVLAWLRKAKTPYRRLLGERAYDLVHAFFGFPTGWLCYRTAGRIPYVISLRGSDVPGDNARLQLEYKVLGPLVFRPIWKRAAALVACSEGLKARAQRFLPSAQIDVIPNGVDLERFRPTSGDEKRSTQSEPLRLLTVGRLSVTKRLALLIEAVERLSGEGLSVHLTIVGGGALEPEIRRLIDSRQLQRVIALAGRRQAEEMPEIYRQHDVFVSASSQEGMSNAMLEAIASGLPLVATHCEGLDELVADNGLVVDEPEPETLAAAISTLIRDPSKRRTMSRAARRQAERFTWRAVADRYQRLYEKLVT